MLGSSLGSSVTTLVHDWSVASAQRARRNAMVATNACAQRRAEREDVDDFLASRAAPEPTATAEADDVRRQIADRG